MKYYVGEYVSLFIVKKMPQGLYLSQSMDSKESVLLPNAYVLDSMQIGESVQVFIYTDSEDRLVATTLKPLIKLDQVALLEIKSISKDGLFLDIGLPKDVFMPLKSKLKNVSENKEFIRKIASGERLESSELKGAPRYKVGEKIVARLSRDKQFRLIAKNDIARFVKKCKSQNMLHKRALALIYAESKLGYSCIVLPQQYSGLIYHRDFTHNLHIDMELFVKIVKIRDDGNLDIMPERNRAALLDSIKSLSKNGEYFVANATNAIKLGMSKARLDKEIKILMESKKIYYVENKGYAFGSFGSAFKKDSKKAYKIIKTQNLDSKKDFKDSKKPFKKDFKPRSKFNNKTNFNKYHNQDSKDFKAKHKYK
nr:S1-like domain-containing RNA-binding protein [Helicobacter saguini]